MEDLDPTRISVLIRARRGDLADFVRIYVPFVYSLARGLSMDESAANDIAQEALLDLLQQMPKFVHDPKKSFRQFIRQIVLRRKIDYLRKRREESLESVALNRGISTDDLAELSDENAAREISDETLDFELRRSCLRTALEEVRGEVYPTTFEAFNLVVLQEVSVAAAARTLGQLPNQVSQNKHRVMKKLHSKMRRLLGRFGDGVV